MGILVGVSSDESSKNALEYALNEFASEQRIYVVHVGNNGEKIMSRVESIISNHEHSDNITIETLPNPNGRTIPKQLVIFAEKLDLDHIVIGDNNRSFVSRIFNRETKDYVLKSYNGAVTTVGKDGAVSTHHREN